MTRRVTRLSRTNRIGITSTLAAGLAAAAFAPAAVAAPSSGGGTGYTGLPVIAEVKCTKGCVAEGQTAQSAGSVKVRRAGSIKVRGKNLAAVHKVLFTGGSNAGDEYIVKPSRVSPTSLSLPVAGGAKSGQIKLIDEAGRKSRASKVRIKILPRGITGNPNGQGFIWPVKGMITGVFGENRGDHMHAGIDIATSSGTPIKAAASGKITFVGSAGGYGNMTCISHGTLSSCYAHQSRFAPGAEVGSPVEQGGVIGYIGCTGNCSGPHVHFEIRQGSEANAKPLNPMDYLPEGGNASRASASTALRGHTDVGQHLPVYDFDQHGQ